jgi:hypothetical protein
MFLVAALDPGADVGLLIAAVLEEGVELLALLLPRLVSVLLVLLDDLVGDDLLIVLQL